MPGATKRGRPRRATPPHRQLNRPRFLVDTGASFSIFPHLSSDPGSGPALRNPSGEAIPCWGEKKLAVKFSGCRFEWAFLLAKVNFAILGADFLKHFNLIVDLVANQIVDAVSLQRFAAGPPAATDAPPASRGFFAAIEATPPAFRGIFSEFQSVASAAGSLPPVKHKTVHHIQTAGPSATGRFRRLDPAKLAAAKAELSKLEKDGIIRRSSSNWSAPLHMVMKPDGKWRPCGDYRRLNLATTPDSYPLPNIQDLSSRLHGCSIFSKLDLRKGYYQIPVQEGDLHKTAVITPFGLWEFLRMPFGLRNAGQSFQRFMDELLSGLDFAFCYLDDILIGSSSTKEHLHHLHLVLQRLQEYGLVLNMEKCEQARQEIDFLGHHITADGASPILKHVQAIQDFPAPQDKKQLQTFLGMVNFYRRFILAAANILLPLTDVLRAEWSWTWAPAVQHSFQLVKETLAEVATLTHPDPAADLSLAVDASNTHIGAVLQQWQPGGGGGWRPLSFFSKKLDTAQLKYSAFDREMLAAYLSVRHFRYMLDGKKFHILSDHKPLTQALHRISDPWTPRVQRQLSFLAKLTSDIRHVPGKANVVADALSRPHSSAVASVKEPPGSLPPGREASQIPLHLQFQSSGRRRRRWQGPPARLSRRWSV